MAFISDIWIKPHVDRGGITKNIREQRGRRPNYSTNLTPLPIPFSVVYVLGMYDVTSLRAPPEDVSIDLSRKAEFILT